MGTSHCTLVVKICMLHAKNKQSKIACLLYHQPCYFCGAEGHECEKIYHDTCFHSRQSTNIRLVITFLKYGQGVKFIA